MDRLDALLGALARQVSALAVAVAVLAVGLVGVGTVMPSEQAPDRAYTELAPGDPVRITVPRLGVRAPVVPVAVSAERVLDPPEDVLSVGWWDQSAQPGSRAGSTVMTGHAVREGGGALDELRAVRQGDVVEVVTRRGLMRYEVLRRKVYGKEQLAADAEKVFGQDGGDGRLVLVSCTDWDGSGYRSNVVVYAAALGQPVEPDAPTGTDTARG